MTFRRGDGVQTTKAIGPLLGGVSAGRYGVVVASNGWGSYTVRVGSEVIRNVRPDQLKRSGSGPFWSQGGGSGRSGPFWAQSSSSGSGSGSRQAPRPLWAQPGPVGSSSSGRSSSGGSSARVPLAPLWSTPRRSRRRRDVQEPEGGWSGRSGRTPPPLFG